MLLCDCGNSFVPTGNGNGTKMCSSCVVNRRRFVLKKRAIDYMGGNCAWCGYNKCMDALEFDHIDPSTKKFNISGNHCLSWDKLKLELDKCRLLCANCHRERHSTDKPKNLSYSLYDKDDHIEKSICKICCSSFIHIKSDARMYCSRHCASRGSIRITWPPVEEVVRLVTSTSYLHAAKVLGVVDNSIRKFLLRNGIDPKTIRSIKNNGY